MTTKQNTESAGPTETSGTAGGGTVRTAERDAGCFKAGCHGVGITWELDYAVEAFPSRLCRSHAKIPRKIGTLMQPTVIHSEAQDTRRGRSGG